MTAAQSRTDSSKLACVEAGKAFHLGQRHKETSPRRANIILYIPFLMSCINIADAHRKAIVTLKTQEKLTVTHLVLSTSVNTSPIINHDP